ncbi:MAG: glycosyltransferase family 2 protein [Candidatus Omnitrophota bacterium]|nr:glycosyltransferase family 2 protein [Candidatus Omnitrophota bacterium]
MTPGVSVIILNYNGKEFLRGCLTSVLKQSYNNFKVILVDNHSTDGSLDFVKDNFPGVEVLALDKNYGFPKGHNIGIKYSLEKYNPDYFLLLNNDINIVREDTIKRLIEVAENDKETGILGCKLIYPDGKAQCVGGKMAPLSRFLFVWMDPAKEVSNEVYDVDIIIGAALLIKAAVINRIGLFDEGFSPILSEEIDLCIRAKRCGFLLKIVSSLEIIHYLGQCLKRQPSDYISWVNKKNYVRFILLNAPSYLFIFGIICEFYNTFKYFAIAMWDKKQAWKDILTFSFSPYLVNIRNLREIIWKRTHRRVKLWF